MNAADLALLASYPPPYGGVANHVQRLAALLEQRGVEYVVYNAVSDSGDGRRVIPVARNRRRWTIAYAARARERAIYIFSSRLEVWLLGALMARQRRKRVVIRLRNVALHDYMADRTKRVLASTALRSATRIVAVSRALAAAAMEAGVPADRIIHQPGFLPPPPSASRSDELAPAQREFLDAHQPIIAANGKVDWHRGTDLYGLDHLVELVAALRSEHPRIGLTVSFWDHLPEDESRVAALLQRARTLGVGDHVYFHTESRPFVPVLSRADVFVRPTFTDGDANSVREALYLGVPAVASDVVERPEGTILHRTRDLHDLVEKVRGALTSPVPRMPRTAIADLEGIERYIEMLAELSRP